MNRRKNSYAVGSSFPFVVKEMLPIKMKIVNDVYLLINRRRPT